MILTLRQRDDILRHARRIAAMATPEEAVGVIRGDVYWPLLNRADDPCHHFNIAAEDLMPRGNGQDVSAIVHSHPGGPAWPSYDDMIHQASSGVPWHIAVVATAALPTLHDEVFTFGLPPTLDLNQGYRHGVHDCYSLIRGFYAEKMKVELPDFPRAWEWWHSKDGAKTNDMYEAGLTPAGFVDTATDTARQYGDVFLARVRSDVINHAGIWLGDGLILHHLGGGQGAQDERLPRKEPAERWMKFIDRWVRHQTQDTP